MMMNGRVVILSDLHLGRRYMAARSAEALRPLWQGARQLILNGDAAEIHHPKYRVNAAHELRRLLEYCEEDDVEVTTLSGNHDAYLSDRRHLALARGKVFITHGDALHRSIAPWSPAAYRMGIVHDLALGKLREAERGSLDSALAASQHAAAAEWDHLERWNGHSPWLEILKRPWMPLVIMNYWFNVPDLAIEFLDRYAPEAKFLVFGHTHRPGIWKVQERTLINTGAFGFGSKPRAVVVDNDELSVWKIERKDGVYGFSEEAIERFLLATATAEIDEAAEAAQAARQREAAEAARRAAEETRRKAETMERQRRIDRLLMRSS